MNEPSLLPRTRLFTVFGTVLYVEPFTGELRHGPVESSPANAFFESVRVPEAQTGRVS